MADPLPVWEGVLDVLDCRVKGIGVLGTSSPSHLSH